MGVSNRATNHSSHSRHINFVSLFSEYAEPLAVVVFIILGLSIVSGILTVTVCFLRSRERRNQGTSSLHPKKRVSFAKKNQLCVPEESLLDTGECGALREPFLLVDDPEETEDVLFDLGNRCYLPDAVFIDSPKVPANTVGPFIFV